ncbi:MAG: hypothetical protein HN593_00330 [Lentimicrobiaceae bacterium]|jgi:hypothetical protein|nr:hypothetical protein [Lentimicrobiaceae bacterium]
MHHIQKKSASYQLNMLQRILNVEEVIYSSNLNEENLMRRVENLFEQKSLGLAGKIISEDEFTAYEKLIVIGWDMPYLRRKAAYLKGKITQGEKGTLIKLKVSPNSFLPIFAIVAAITGVIITLIGLLNTHADKLFLIFGIAFFTLGIVYYPVSTILRNRLKNKVTKYLNLSKVQ